MTPRVASLIPLFLDEVRNPLDAVFTVDEVGAADDFLLEGDGGLDAIDLELGKGRGSSSRTIGGGMYFSSKIVAISLACSALSQMTMAPMVWSPWAIRESLKSLMM